MINKQAVPAILARLRYIADQNNGEFTMATFHDAVRSVLDLTPMETGGAMHEYEPYLREEQGYIEYGPTSDYMLTEKGKRAALK